MRSESVSEGTLTGVEAGTRRVRLTVRLSLSAFSTYADGAGAEARRASRKGLARCSSAKDGSGRWRKRMPRMCYEAYVLDVCR